MTTWLRFYTEALNDRKVQELSGDYFKSWVNLLCLAGMNDGQIKSAADAAFALRTTEMKAKVTVAYLAGRGLLDPVEGGYFAPHNWSRRQYKSDTSNDRVARYREKQRNGDRNVTGNVTDTLHVTPPDTDTDTDTESEKKETRARRALLLAPGWPSDYAEKFWNAYPNKVGKAHALAKLKRVAKSGKAAFEVLMGALAIYANKTDDRPFCNPATWITQERWTDEPATPIGGQRGSLLAATDRIVGRLHELNRPLRGHDATMAVMGHFADQIAAQREREGQDEAKRLEGPNDFPQAA